MKLIESTNCTSTNVTEIKFELKINLRPSVPTLLGQFILIFSHELISN